jgi:hypothetical protein
MVMPLPTPSARSGHVFRRSRSSGDVWHAKYRLPDGRQVRLAQALNASLAMDNIQLQQRNHARHDKEQPNNNLYHARHGDKNLQAPMLGLVPFGKLLL